MGGLFPEPARRRDLAWEALVQVTHANPAVERGVLNKALKAIREACATAGTVADNEVALEIEQHAEMYRQTFPGIVLTPMALAKHWFRVAQPRGGSTSAEEAYDIVRRTLDVHD